jgi:hypothetical protein
MKIVDTEQLMVTTYRQFSTSGDFVYRHDIQWRPKIQYGVIVQRIKRTTWTFGTVFNSTNSSFYWELWEIYKGHVYPFNKARKMPPFIPEGGTLMYGIHFDTTSIPYMKPKVGKSFPAKASKGDHVSATHDRFTEELHGKATKKGRWEIYGEAYLLHTAHVYHFGAWLNRFAVKENGGAGNLPCRPGDGFLPLNEPTVRRYEAGRWDFTGNNRISENQDYPNDSKLPRWPCGIGGQVNPTGSGLNQTY